METGGGLVPAKGKFTLCDDSTDKWPKANMGEICIQTEKALRAKKYLLIWDRIGTTT